MSLRVINTGDGSKSYYSVTFDEPYHSRHGAIQESQHVFIEKGLAHYHKTYAPDSIKIFEMGFGTGLNALLSYHWAERNKTRINYISIEKFPLPIDSVEEMNYAQQLEIDPRIFRELHESSWQKENDFSDVFSLRKLKIELQECTQHLERESFDLVFFDAFAPSSQPQLWETSIFEKVYSLLKPGGMLTTYCAKGQVRRNMIAAGFRVEKVEGPPGKREMLRANK